MGILELILGLILFVIIANIFFSFIPIPNNIVGTIIAVIVLVMIWRLVF